MNKRISQDSFRLQSPQPPQHMRGAVWHCLRLCVVLLLGWHVVGDISAFTNLTNPFVSVASAQEDKMNNNLEKATFAGGCFWCMQPFLENIKGVKSVIVGYTGGHTQNPTYEEVSSGDTGHAEAVEVTFDPTVASYAKILNVFLHNIDPTQKNGQFYDEGTHYRSAIFYHGDEQKRLAQEALKALADSGRFDKPIVVELVESSTFYPAEDYHQAYYKKNPGRYNAYHKASGRDEFLEKKWGKKAHE